MWELVPINYEVAKIINLSELKIKIHINFYRIFKLRIRRKSIESNVDNIPVIESIPEIKQSEHELAEIRAAEGVAIQQTITFLESAIKLEAMKAQCAIAENNYNQELTKLQSQFYQYLESLNGRSDILMKSLQRMNTAQNHEQLKSGFLALADKSRNLFEDGDWEDFINGTKTIEL